MNRHPMNRHPLVNYKGKVKLSVLIESSSDKWMRDNCGKLKKYTKSQFVREALIEKIERMKN